LGRRQSFELRPEKRRRILQDLIEERLRLREPLEESLVVGVARDEIRREEGGAGRAAAQQVEDEGPPLRMRKLPPEEAIEVGGGRMVVHRAAVFGFVG
jgi:hypothetical protein